MSEEALDPISHLLNPLSDEVGESPLEEDELASRQKAKKVLFKAAPEAAKKLVHISRTGDFKESLGASQAILDRVGLSKGEAEPPKADRSLLPLTAIVGALLGIGKVMGSDISSLRNVTPSEGDLVETPKKTLQPSLRSQPTSPIHGQRLSGKKKTKKISQKKKASR